MGRGGEGGCCPGSRIETFHGVAARSGSARVLRQTVGKSRRIGKDVCQRVAQIVFREIVSPGIVLRKSLRPDATRVGQGPVSAPELRLSKSLRRVSVPARAAANPRSVIPSRRAISAIATPPLRPSTTRLDLAECIPSRAAKERSPRISGWGMGSDTRTPRFLFTENKNRTKLGGCQAIVERDIPANGLKGRAST